MKTRVCYFCNSIINIDGYCRACKDKYDLNYVYTDYFDIENNGDIKLNCSAIGLNINGIYYYVVLRFLDYHTHVPVNETIIYMGFITTIEPILTLPGYPLTPANVKEKLKKYLIFS
jgi:hypothetical protein